MSEDSINIFQEKFLKLLGFVSIVRLDHDFTAFKFGKKPNPIIVCHKNTFFVYYDDIVDILRGEFFNEAEILNDMYIEIGVSKKYAKLLKKTIMENFEINGSVKIVDPYEMLE